MGAAKMFAWGASTKRPTIYIHVRTKKVSPHGEKVAKKPPRGKKAPHQEKNLHLSPTSGRSC